MENATEKFFQELDEQYATGDMEKVERFLQTSARSYRPCCGGFNANYLAVLSELGGFYRGTSKYTASVEAFRAANEIIMEFIGKDSLEYATNLNNLAGTYRLMGEYDKSLRTFTEAMDTYRATVGTDNYLFASALNNVALLHQDMKEYEQAVSCLLQALGVLENLPDTQGDVATTYNNLAALYNRLGDDAKAKEALARSIALYESLPEESPHYAAALNLHAAFLYRDGKYGEAKDAYLKVLQEVERFFGRNIEYGIACDNLRRVYEKLGDNAQAEQYMKQAVDIYSAVYGKDHEISKQAVAVLRELEAGRNSCGV
ncbi:tetratricopeptide repeat protein [Christensenella timonensis]|uniref:tetratricopeptide repeat protein n=1 Tax=Christensenella timonensis TaxID=1816678 RepID=UPI00082AF24C|nr:tetratricopeptide repeat protein [Christensenella timonensis]